VRVFVVMGNDYPDSVFASEADAEAYIQQKKDEPGNRHEHGGGYRIYWRAYEFELREAKK
jgi:hypothetical protein